MPTHPSWAEWFINHANNDAGNRNLAGFSGILSSGDPAESKIRALVEEIDTIILAADANGNVMILHSPKNFGGTRSRPENKVVCMLGLGAQASCVILDIRSALADFNIIVPSVQDIAGCKSAEEVAAIPEPEENGVIGFEGSAIFIPGPVLRNAIISANTKDPFGLIPIVSQAAKSFDGDNEVEATSAVHHADDLNAWLYGVKRGLILESCYSINPDDTEITSFSKERHLQCISSTMANARLGGGVDNASIISQLTNAISVQAEEAAESNSLRRKEIERQIEREEKKNDKTKKLHAPFLNMLKRAAAPDRNNEDSDLAPSCLHFLNADNAGLAAHKLAHLFVENNSPDVTFATGTVQKLYLGDFLWANSSSPSNFTVFAFSE